MPEAGERRYSAFRRLWAMMEFLRQYRFGMTVGQIEIELRERGHEWCNRTIRRDLQFLKECGLVITEDAQPEYPVGVKRWIWNHDGRVFEQEQADA